MKSYKVKSLQFQILPVLLETTQAEMSARIGVKPNYMSRHLADGEFRMRDVLAICNEYHVAFSLFITTDSTDAFGGKIIADMGEWKPFVFSSSRVKQRMKKDGISLNNVSDVLGLARNTAKSILKEQCPLSRFVDFCNAFGLNIGEFVSDPTLPQISDERAEIRKEVERLRNELSEARASAFAAHKELERLKAENARLELELMHRRQYSDDKYEILNVAEEVK